MSRIRCCGSCVKSAKSSLSPLIETSTGPIHLEATIRTRGGPTSLPVFTLANADRVLLEPTYANRVAERLLDYFFIIDQVRGTGRLYVP
jgi:hypothetical protein